MKPAHGRLLADGLLSGLLRCERCGHRLNIRYWGKRDTAARYLCSDDFQTGGRYCLGFGGVSVDRRVSEVIPKALSPYGVQASLAAIEQSRAQGSGRCERRLHAGQPGKPARVRSGLRLGLEQ